MTCQGIKHRDCSSIAGIDYVLANFHNKYSHKVCHEECKWVNCIPYTYLHAFYKHDNHFYSEMAVSQDTKQITFDGCAAYGIIPEPAEDKSCEYETIPLARLQPARGTGPTSSPQTSGLHTPALHDHTAVVSGQARSTTPSHSPPQELGGDEPLYEPTGAPASTATPTTAAPTLSLGTK